MTNVYIHFEENNIVLRILQLLVIKALKYSFNLQIKCILNINHLKIYTETYVKTREIHIFLIIFQINQFWIRFYYIFLSALCYKPKGRGFNSPWFHWNFKANSHIACRAHAVPLPCRAAKILECVFPIWFTQCGRVWFTLAMPRPCHALTMPFFARPRHSTTVERRPVGCLPAFGFFRLPRRVPRRLLSEAYQSSSQRSIPTTVKSGSSTLQKGRFVKLLD